MEPKEIRDKVRRAALECPNCHGGVIVADDTKYVTPEDQEAIAHVVRLIQSGVVTLISPEDAEAQVEEGCAGFVS